MKCAGQVIYRYGRSTFILRCDPGQLPPLNVEVTDRRLRPVGTLVELFGNIRAPYAVVRCSPQHTGCTPGEKLFTR